MKKQGEGPPAKTPPSLCLCASVAAPSPILRTHFQVPYPASPVFATLTKTAGVCTNNSRLGTTPLLAFNLQSKVPPAPSLPATLSELWTLNLRPPPAIP